MKIKRCLSFVLVCLLFIASSTSVLASEPMLQKKTIKPKAKPVIVKGDIVIFEHALMEITAKGDVEILYDNYHISSQEAHFSQKNRNMRFPSTLNLKTKEMVATANSFNYDLSTYKGEALEFEGKVDRLLIKGDKFVFTKDKITIDNAFFTTCQKDHWSHYEVKAKRIYLYPQLGFFIAMRNKITVEALPFPILIPTYLYGAPRYGVLSQSTLFPVFGSNKVEGKYIKERLGYFMSDKSSGTVELGVTEKLGVVGGVTHAYVFKKHHKVQGRAHIAGTDGFVGHAMVQRRLMVKNEKRSTGLINDFFKKFSYSDSDSSTATLWYKHREIINDHRVSFKPVAELDFRSIPLSFYKLELDEKLSYGRVREERGIEDFDDPNRERVTAYKTSTMTSLSRRYALNSRTTLKTSGHFYGFWYSTNDSWQRTFAKASIKWKWPILNPELSYTKRISNIGNSPFRYDRSYAIESDELGLIMSRDFEHVVLASDLNYNLEDHKVRSWEIKAGLKFHCWQLNLIWRTHQNGIGFGIDIY